MIETSRPDEAGIADAARILSYPSNSIHDEAIEGRVRAE
jgi:hypothetical protein